MVFWTVVAITIAAGIEHVILAGIWEKPTPNQQSAFEAMGFAWKAGIGAIFGLLGGRPLEMRICATTIICLILTAANPLQAQDRIENSETDFYVQTAGGNPTVCGLEFVVVYHDHTYRDGALAGVTGSLGWVEDKGNIGLMLKIVGADYPNADKLDLTPKPLRLC